MKRPFRLFHRAPGAHFIFPIDFYQTKDGLTVVIEDRYARIGEAEWEFVRRETRTYESHETEWEYESCSICRSEPPREYGVDRLEVETDWHSIPDEVEEKCK